MAQLKLDIAHALTVDEAVQRIKDKLASVRAEYADRLEGFREEWRDHTFSFGLRVLGMPVSGTVAVEPKKLRLAAELPMAAAFFKSAIEDRIRKEVDALLG